MAALIESRPQNLKRQQAEADLSQDNLSAQSTKKFKKHHSASRFPPPDFWDSLSKIWLTPQALREVDRRNHINYGAFARSPAQYLGEFDRHSQARSGACTRAQARSLRELMVAPYEWMSQFSKLTLSSKLSNILISNIILIYYLN